MPAGNAAVVRAEGLRKRYGARTALAGVSLEARAGELVACIGPNGAGKTTLLSILAGAQRADSGAVERSSSKVGWVPQRAGVYGKLSVEENLRLFARIEGVVDEDEAVGRLLEQTGLAQRAGEPVDRLSGGNRQRVNVAVGLVGAPALLLLDEPSAALDPRQRALLWRFVLELADGGTAVVFATHDVAEAERYADRMLVLADGERLFWGGPGELLDAVGREATVPAPAGRSDFESAFVDFLRQRGH
jgi:ABC-2 type transport system ATP-binding protein